MNRSALLLLSSVSLAACTHSSPPPVEPTAPPASALPEVAVAPEPTPAAEPPPPPPPPPPAPVDLPPARPCMVRVEPRPTDGDRGCITIDRVQPESVPLSVCVAEASTLRFRYDEQGRIVEAPSGSYAYRADGRATWTHGRERIALTFDDVHRLLTRGRARYAYDSVGRLLRVEERGHHLGYVYGPDDTYTTEHDYPDTDEFCVADRVAVTRDAQGRVATDRYDNCGINEIPRTLSYHYDEAGALAGIDIDLQSDGTVEAVVTLSTTCAE